MSDTGYIRLSVAQLQDIQIIHLISGMDEDAPLELPHGAVQTAISGYTEWISNGGPVITIGWDWQMQLENTHVLLRRIGMPSSNVMLQTNSQLDLGHAKTASILESFIDGIDWQKETLQSINIRYNG
jgi:hypothetical protein